MKREFSLLFLILSVQCRAMEPRFGTLTQSTREKLAKILSTFYFLSQEELLRKCGAPTYDCNAWQQCIDLQLKTGKMVNKLYYSKRNFTWVDVAQKLYELEDYACSEVRIPWKDILKL